MYKKALSKILVPWKYSREIINKTNNGLSKIATAQKFVYFCYRKNRYTLFIQNGLAYKFLNAIRREDYSTSSFDMSSNKILSNALLFKIGQSLYEEKKPVHEPGA